VIMPVVKRYNKDEFDIVYIDTNDVLYMFSHKSSVLYQTRQGTFSKISTFEEEERFFLEQGFQKVDRCYLVQMEKAEFYDEDTQSLYFDPLPTSQNSLKAPVSRTHRKDIAEVPTTSSYICQQKLANANG